MANLIIVSTNLLTQIGSGSNGRASSTIPRKLSQCLWSLFYLILISFALTELKKKILELTYQLNSSSNDFLVTIRGLLKKTKVFVWFFGGFSVLQIFLIQRLIFFLGDLIGWWVIHIIFNFLRILVFWSFSQIFSTFCPFSTFFASFLSVFFLQF